MNDNDMRRVVSSDQIDLSEWSFGYGDLDEVICKGFKEALEEVLTQTPPTLSLPMVWGPKSDGMGGTAVAAADMIYLHLPLDKSGDGTCVWAVTLEELVIYAFEMDGDPPSPHPSMDPRAKIFADRLREIADKIDPPPQP